MGSVVFSNPSKGQSQVMQNSKATIATSLINQIKNSINPQQTFNELLSSNPEMQEGQQLVNKYGNGDPKAAFFALAKEKGIDPSAIMSQLGLQ